MKTEISGTRIIDGANKQLKISDLKKVNVLFGKNGTGKSSFLRNVYKSDAEDYHLVVPERGGAQMKYTSNVMDQEYDDNQRLDVRSRNFDQNYRSRAVSRATGIMNSIGYRRAHKEEKDVIFADEISSLFSVFLPEFKIVFAPNIPHNIEIFRIINQTEEKVTNTEQLSSGQTEAISLAADIITQAVEWNGTEKTLLIDEPDVHLHIDLENRFAIFINEIINKFNIQVIIATHSSGLIASLLSQTQEVGIICFDKRSEVISAIKKEQAAIFTNLLSIELALAVVLNRKIVIVDGNDDFLVWNQAARCPSFDEIALIQTNGGDILKYKQNAEAILDAALDNPSRYGVTILDGDGKNSYTNNPEDLLPCERLRCYSLENLLLTNEVLAEIDPVIDLNQKLNDLKSADGITDDEKDQIDKIIKDKQNTRVSKDLIKKIHSYVDNHSSSRDWRILLGKVLGKSRPVGELASFLSEAVVEYLWTPNSNPTESVQQ